MSRYEETKKLMQMIMGGRSVISDPSRYADIGALLGQIFHKFNRQNDEAFIVLVAPFLSQYDSSAVAFALLELLHSPKPDWWDGMYPEGERYPDLATIYLTLQPMIMPHRPTLQDKDGAFYVH